MDKNTLLLTGLVRGGKLPLAFKAIAYAENLHSGQKRKGGEEYITHPIKVALYLWNHAIHDDKILAAAVLHDVLEDTAITRQDLEAEFGKEVADIVKLVTKKLGQSMADYFNAMLSDPRAVMIKAADRTHNVSSMVNVFSVKNLEEYIKETEDYILPIMKVIRRTDMNYTPALVSLGDHIKSVLEPIKAFVAQKKENKKLQKENAKLLAKLKECETAKV